MFWASLLVYCAAFGGFYFTTQYTYDQIEYQELHGAFLQFGDSICKHGEACSDIQHKNMFDSESKQYKTYVEVQHKGKQPLDASLLQNNYSIFLTELPWYVRLQFNNKMEINTVNGKPFKG